ncbi:hypothetical protein U8M15_28525, partial [Klebsiella pneumoniae]|uniref:hypothetical protein n=1 Tax=Klebsiella pneumoniae TaxID=573 RepID=UPI002AE063FE
MKGVVRFCKKGKLSPWYVGHYEILRRVGNVAYEIELPSSLRLVHLVFYVFILRKCIGDPSSFVPLEGLSLMDS